MDFSLLAVLIFLLFLFLIFIFGRARPTGPGQGRKYRGTTWQDDNLSILHPPIVPLDGYNHTVGDHHGTMPLIDPNPDTTNVDFGNSWDSSTSVDTSSSSFDSGGDLGSAFASEIGSGSDFGGSDFGGGGTDFSGGGDGGSF